MKYKVFNTRYYATTSTWLERAREHHALRERPQAVVAHREAARGPQRRRTVYRVREAPDPGVQHVADVVELNQAAATVPRRDVVAPPRIIALAAAPERQLEQREDDDEEDERADARRANARAQSAGDRAHRSERYRGSHGRVKSL
ncbi:hypothetical protein CBD41_04915 [bacterium TMED181]|nr:MAG: hypothetical protein CBD41_04915 [bacterium TMED181]